MGFRTAVFAFACGLLLAGARAAPCPAAGAQWVWSGEKLPERNSYVEFLGEFTGDGREVTLRVAAAGEFVARVNGKVASFGVYRDFPDHPAYNEVRVATVAGANEVWIGVFHSGNGFGSHSDGEPGLWAEVVDADGRTLSATGEKGWTCRPLVNYTFGKLPITFGTLDWTYEYDANRPTASWREPVAAAPHAAPAKRPVGAPHLGEPIVAREIYRDEGEIGFDLGTMACGWLEFGVKAPKGTRIRIKNREVLNDGRVKIFGDVQPGDFYVADGTASVFRHCYRYYGCRYLAFEFPKDTKGVAISNVKLIPAVYDGFETPPFDCDDEFFNRLHRACVKTLRLCWMGRHVSNVWREQAWYPYDLRFEALYDYTFWGMYGESAANLEQVGRGMLPNGYAPCVGPAVKDPAKRIWIPMYTFAWMTALTENCFYSGDDGLFRKFSEQIKGMLDAALAIQKDGLYLPPEGMMRWDYCDPALEDWVGTPNDPPNAFYNLYAREALLALAPLYRAHGEAEYAEKLERLATDIGERAVKHYWDAERGLFADRVDKDGRKIRFYSHIQYLFLAQGLVPASERRAFIERLLKFDLPFGSFASLTFLCKGILAYGTDEQLEQFHAYVKRIYSPMIDGGFDTIWESPRGPKYAGRNGCVCQGWAAFPAWYEAYVLLGVRPTKPGYAAYERKPRLLGGMKRVSGRVMTPQGPVFSSLDGRFVKISFTGDIMCLKEQRKAVEAAKVPWESVFEPVRRVLAGSDYVVGNLETPLAGPEAGYTSADARFNTPDAFAAAAKACGITCADTANNHCMDRGSKGLDRTLEALDRLGMDHFGTYRTREEADAVFMREIGGIRVAFVGATYGTATEWGDIEILPPEKTWKIDFLKRQETGDPYWPKMERPTYVAACVRTSEIGDPRNEPFKARLRAKIAAAKKAADFTVVLPHVGGQFNPAPGDYARHTVGWMAESGADLVVGTHPHTSQRCEIFPNGVPAAYSLGNFAFTPYVGWYIHGQLAEYSAVLHAYLDPKTKKLAKLTFTVVKSVVGADGVSRTYPVKDLYERLTDDDARQFLRMENEAMVNRFRGGSGAVDIEDEYVIWTRPGL